MRELASCFYDMMTVRTTYGNITFLTVIGFVQELSVQKSVISFTKNSLNNDDHVY
jgi:hypothetical protein